MQGRPRLKRGRGGREGREGKGKGGEGREEGDVGGPRDILSRGPRVPSYATVFITVRLLWANVRTCYVSSCPVHCIISIVYIIVLVNEINGDGERYLHPSQCPALSISS